MIDALTYVIIFTIIYVIPRIFIYNREGDIELNIKGINKEEIKKKSIDQLFDRMHHLIIYNEKKVRWPYYLTLSMIASVLLLNVIDRNKFTKENTIITTLLIFFFIELPQRYESAHVRSIQTYESGLLLSRFNELNK